MSLVSETYVDNLLIFPLNLTLMERTLRKILADAGRKLASTDIGTIEIEVPKDESYGDLATPAALGLSKILKKSPRKIADDIVGLIDQKDVFEKIDIAGPGFIN